MLITVCQKVGTTTQPPTRKTVSRMASRESDVESKICRFLREAIKSMPDLSAVTMRMLKEKIAPKFGDEWEAVSNEYKAFIKDEAVKLITEAEKSPEKEKKKKNDLAETKSTPSTVEKKDGRIKFEASVSKSSKKRSRDKGDSSSDGGGGSADDFKDETSRNSGSSKKKNVKIQRKEEPTQKKESGPVQSAEVIRLKSVAKQCG
jgi:hypothetical protein